MATIVLQAAGAWLGGTLGQIGATIGTAAGALAGYVIDRALIESTRHIEGPRLTSAQAFTAEDGAPLPRLYGTARMSGTMIWATRFEEESQTERQGFKGGPRVTSYSYYGNIAFALCEGAVAGVRRIWADGNELDLNDVTFRVYQGNETQAVDPLIEAKQGAGNAPAYRGTAYIVFDHLPLDPYGNRIPQLQFEVMRPLGDLNARVRSVCLIPGATEYGLSPTLVTREITPGETVALNRNVLFGATDIAASLDELQALCPALENVALVVTWFGDDLRAGECTIRPKVTQADETGVSQPWLVSGVARADAGVVSYHDGSAAYGGTPSDRGVIDAIIEIKSRGLAVTLYPFVMMDVPAGNALTDPHTGAGSQPTYPWRGRITCAPGPELADTADKTAVARTQVETFCGSATLGDFAVAEDTVTFSGGEDWGYRRFLLHHAYLAQMAGGVDAFLIGSELRGLTTLRDAANAFPFVEELCALATNVHSLLGGGTRVSYGADWTEYFGHQPADGSGDVFFHLDALWAHADVDAVGIDNYMPLADWRDEDFDGTGPDGFAGPYDRAAMRATIVSGEGFDWYYASDADRLSRTRTPIVDGSYGKDWVFRYKDILSWWSNLHYNRVGGVEAGSPTAWEPQSKPVWLTELGCPAVDKGPNQPNVFPDPKSSESALPYFSSGGRSDIAQRRFLDAHFDHWDTASEAFADAANPISSVYGGRMVDQSRIYCWAWDARPFPAFPQLSGLWSDGSNWLAGHWLTGRLNEVGLGDLVAAILADHGVTDADTSLIEATLTGYLVSSPGSARDALEPLVQAFGLSAAERQGVLRFSGAQEARTAIELEELIAPDDGAVVQSTRRPEHGLASEIVISFSDPMNGYQSATARAALLGAEAERQHGIGLQAIMDPDMAESLAEDWLHRARSARETLSFAVPIRERLPEPGALIRLPERRGAAEFLVTAVEEGISRAVTAEHVLRAQPSSWRPALPASTISSTASATGAPLALFLDLPMTPGASAASDQFRVAARAVPWRPQSVYASPEGTGFELRAGLSKRATIGKLEHALEPRFEGRIDHVRTLDVRLYDGELSSVTRLQMLNGANAAAIQSADGGWEIIQFETAEEVSASVWRLSGLLRGQTGSGLARLAGAETGAWFVLLDGGVAPAGLKSAETGLELNWRVGPSRADFSDARFATQSATGGIRALTPLSPVHLRAARSLAGDLVVSWIRRGRIDADGWGTGDIPLGEETEAYLVEISAGGETVRSVEVTEPAWLYAAADIAADFAVLPAEIAVTVRQKSATVGPGDPATRAITLT